MDAFSKIFDRAANYKGGETELEAALPWPKSATALKKLGDDRYLSAMAKRVFQAGFVWKVVDNKWPAFEEAFYGFDPLRVAHFSDEKLEELATDRQLIRHYRKMKAVRDNAVFVVETAEEHGSFAKVIASWPSEDIVGLWKMLSKRGARMGGRSAAFVLRHLGKDTFIVTGDVTRALMGQGIVDREPTSQRDLQKTQEAFNLWSDESARPLCQISRILACSVS